MLLMRYVSVACHRVERAEGFSFDTQLSLSRIPHRRGVQGPTSPCLWTSSLAGISSGLDRRCIELQSHATNDSLHFRYLIELRTFSTYFPYATQLCTCLRGFHTDHRSNLYAQGPYAQNNIPSRLIKRPDWTDLQPPI